MTGSESTQFDTYCRLRLSRERRSLPSRFLLSLGISEHKNDRISPQKHLTDESIHVYRFRSARTFSSLVYLAPHLLHVLEDHVAVPIKGLHSTQELSVVSAINQHLRIRLHAMH